MLPQLAWAACTQRKGSFSNSHAKPSSLRDLQWARLPDLYQTAYWLAGVCSVCVGSCLPQKTWSSQDGLCLWPHPQAGILNRQPPRTEAPLILSLDTAIPHKEGMVDTSHTVMPSHLQTH